MKEFGILLGGIASVLWPLLFILLVLKFSGSIQKILESWRSRKVTIKVGGNELTMEQVSEQQRHLINDLQEQFISIKNQIKSIEFKPTRETFESQTDESTSIVKTILWVDDHPENNSQIIAQLEEIGVKTEIALSTTDGIGKYEERQFDRIISDMGRKESGKYNEIAGLEFTMAIRKKDPNIPILIFCSRKAALAYRDKAKKAGANDITYSATSLLQALGLNPI